MATADRAPEADQLPQEEPLAEAEDSIENSAEDSAEDGAEDGAEGGVARIQAGLAEPGQRLLARIVDTLVVGLPVVAVVRAMVPAKDVDIVAPLAVAGFLLLYEWIQLALWGRTLGKRLAGIEVVRLAAPEGLSEPVAPSLGASAAAPENVGFEKYAEGSNPPKGAAESSKTLKSDESEVSGEGDNGAPGEGLLEGADEAWAEGPLGAPLTKPTVPREPLHKPARLGVARSLLRSAVYAVPIAARPVPVFGLIAGLFWVGNAALMYEGVRRQALHDRLAATIVVKRGVV